MRVPMTQCDNPKCENVARPERPDGPADKKYLAPYGWLTMKGGFVGTGPNFEIEVCSPECAAPAIVHVTNEAEQSR